MLVDNNTQVMLVDDDQDVLDSYKLLLSIRSIKSRSFADPTQALAALPKNWPGVVILDMYMPQMSGMEFLTQIKAFDEHIPVILVTGHGDIPMAVQALQQGACNFLEKPINPTEFLQLVSEQIEERSTYFKRKAALNKKIKKQFVGKSARSTLLRKHIVKLSMLDKHVSVIGKPGTGRSHVAALIHEYRHQSPERMVKISGHQINNFSDLENAFKKAGMSTILVSHIEKMDVSIQQKLLDILLTQEHKEVFNTRVIATFEDNPEMLMANNRLIPTLFYMLSQGTIELPELTERPDDIAHLFRHFVKQSCKTLNKDFPDIEPHYLLTLRNHLWPGNIRELKNVAELYAVGIMKLTKQERLQNPVQHKTPLDSQVEHYEKQLIEDALYLHSGRVTEAANHLQIPRKKLYLRMKKHSLEKEAYKSQ